MSRLIEFVYFCDNTDDHKANTVNGETVLVWSPKREQVLEVELCEDCQQGLNLSGLTELADTRGREIAEPDIDPLLVCPHGCNNGRPYKSIGGKNHHMTRKHPEEEQSV